MALIARVARSEDPRDWAPIFKKVTFQLAYRVLGQVSLYCPIDVGAKAIDILCKEEGMGSWKWLMKDRILLWKDIPINEAMKIHAYVYGSPIRRKNTVLTRVGFWRAYFFELMATTIDAIRPRLLLR